MKTKINDGGKAFPVVLPDGYFEPGMSLRAWLAGQAYIPFQLVNACLDSKFPDTKEYSVDQALQCQAALKVMAADVLIAELEKGTK